MGGKEDSEESRPLTQHTEADIHDRYDPNGPRASTSTVSTSSLVLEHISSENKEKQALQYDGAHGGEAFESMELEDQVAWRRTVQPADTKARRVLYILIGVGAVGWLAALFLFLSSGTHKAVSRPHNPHATSTIGHGRPVSLNSVLMGEWYAENHGIRWTPGPNGEDGLLLERNGGSGRDYLVVEDVRFRGDDISIQRDHSTTLMRDGSFTVNGLTVRASEAWPNTQHTKVLVQSSKQKLWRHSNLALYWIFDVETQEAEAVDPKHSHDRIQKAVWSPKGDAVFFVRDNNMYIRHLDESEPRKITRDGGTNVFYGVPDWVYEEEVFQSDTATWPSDDGRFVAYLRTDESRVPSFPVQYFFSRPSGKQPNVGEENYPDVRQIKYPKAGSPMSVVSLEFYDVEKKEIFRVKIADDFADHDRLITEVLWAGESGQVLVRCTNRESDILKMILIDAKTRKGKTIREKNVAEMDGGWFERTQATTFIPADPANGRDHDGYIDTVIHEGYDHLGYFTPVDNPEPKMLTQGKWEVVKAPSAVSLASNIVYFVATKHGSTQRHVYTVDLHKGPDSITAVTDTNEIGYYEPSFSTSGSFMLLSYKGPDIPWQRVKSTPTQHGDKLDVLIEDNARLRALVESSELPIEIYQTINVDGFELNLVERRPPHFDERKKYPVLFFLYNGPGFQQVDRQFGVDFQSYVASSLGYIVVTLDGRGTGYLGRAHRCIIRGNLGYWEAHDQIAAAKMWAAKKYVDESRLAIWGWSYGGFMTLKTLEADAGQTFKYGMAVAPVTDWRYYDSIYTERYMHLPQNNKEGYDNATVSNMTALAENVRFLVMHGYSDDNVHFQNTLSLLDKLDEAGVTNYDTHVFPDSDHSIYFHGAHWVVYRKLNDWLINAFNGEWLRTADPQPLALDS